MLRFIYLFDAISSDYKLVISPSHRYSYNIELKRLCDNHEDRVNIYDIVGDKLREYVKMKECDNGAITQYSITISNLDKKDRITFSGCYLSRKYKLKRWYIPQQYNQYKLGPILCQFQKKGISCKDPIQKFISNVRLSTNLNIAKKFYIEYSVICLGGERKFKFDKYKLTKDNLIGSKRIELDFNCYNGIDFIEILYNSDLEDSVLEIDGYMMDQAELDAIFNKFKRYKDMKYMILCTAKFKRLTCFSFWYLGS